MPALRTLSVTDKAAGAAGLSALVDVPIEELTLNGPGIDDAALQAVAEWRSLRRLWVRADSPTAEGLALWLA